jgi:uncharacterized protein YndB with AHSA1/START domain
MIRKAALSFSTLFLTFLVVGLLLPGELRIQRSIEIAAPPDKVFPLVNDLHAFNRWSPWQSSGIAYAFSGPGSGVGARMTWAEPGEGGMTGSQEITRSEPPRQVVYDLDFGLRGGAQATMELEPAAGGTRATWGFVYRIGYDIMGRYIAALTKGRVADKYADGLARLRALVETGAATP